MLTMLQGLYRKLRGSEFVLFYSWGSVLFQIVVVNAVGNHFEMTFNNPFLLTSPSSHYINRAMTWQKKHTVMAVMLMLGYVDLLTFYGKDQCNVFVWAEGAASCSTKG